MISKKYRISFTSGSLHQHESVQLAELYRELGDWKTTRSEALLRNLLQARTERTAKTVCREIIDRLKTLSKAELDFLIDSGHKDQAHILWLAVCRLYQFVADFVMEVIRERFLSMKIDLTFEDFDAFFNRKSEWHDELDQASPSTRDKLRQVTFRMLREAELVTKGKTINTVILSPKLVGLIGQNNPDEFLYFPVFESDIKGMSL